MTNHPWKGRGQAEARLVKFCTQVGYVKSKHTDDKSPLEGARLRSRDPFCNFAAPMISLERLKRRGQGHMISGARQNFALGGTGAWRTGSKVRGDKFIQKWKPSGVRSAKCVWIRELQRERASVPQAWRRATAHDDPFSISTLVIISPERLKGESPILYTGRRIYQVLASGW